MVHFAEVLLPLTEETGGFHVKSNGTTAVLKPKEVYLFLQSFFKIFTSALQACLMQHVHFEIKYTKM